MLRRYTTLLLFGLLVVSVGLASCQAAPAPGATAVAETTVTQTPAAATEAAAEPTETLTPASTATDGPSPTPSRTPTRTPIPSPTPVPTVTPTSAPQRNPALQVSEPQPIREGISTPATSIPTAVPTFQVPSGTTNILLLGSDAPVGDQGVKRTDTMIIVSINRNGPTASMISLPRDLYVYIPGGTMNRLNTAVTLGGPYLLSQTILYNFGIPINYYARVDFDGFQDIVDAIGGVEIAVSCKFRDWRIKSPDLDPEDPDNWYVYELEPGIHELDGELALWYARSRLLSDDLDRGRRQQQLLRAMLNQGVDLGLVAQVPTLYSTFQDTVETDMDIGRILQIAALAPAIRENGVQNLYLAGKMESWTLPESNAQVLLPVWEGDNKMRDTFQRLFLPPALNRAERAPITVEIVNATGNPDMALLAADNLAWYGFVPVITEALSEEAEATTTLEYFAPNFKGSYNWLSSWIFSMDQEEIELVTDVGNYPYDYRVILGEDYDPCVNQFFAPQSFLP